MLLNYFANNYFEQAGRYDARVGNLFLSCGVWTVLTFRLLPTGLSKVLCVDENNSNCFAQKIIIYTKLPKNAID